MVVFLSNSAYAASGTTAGGVAVTVTSTHSTAPDLTYTPSPSTRVDYVTSTTAYTIVTASSKTDADTGVQYCLVSANSIIFMRAQQSAGGIDSAGSTPGTEASNFTARGGS